MTKPIMKMSAATNTSTTPNATLEPARREGCEGAAYAGAWGWYAAEGGGGGGAASTTAAAAGVGSSAWIAGASVTVSGAAASVGTSAVIASGSGVSAGLFLPGAKNSGLPARTSGLTWTLGSPSLVASEVVSFEVERLRLLIRPPPYTATLASHARHGAGRRWARSR